MADELNQFIEYHSPPVRRQPERLIRFGASAAVAADVALLAAVFIWNGGRIWGPYLNPPVTIYWAQPIAAVSSILGIVGVFTSAVGLARSSVLYWKVIAATAAVGFLLGTVCIVYFGLL